MKRYAVTVEISRTYTVNVDAETEDDATQTAEQMDPVLIERGCNELESTDVFVTRTIPIA